MKSIFSWCFSFFFYFTVSPTKGQVAEVEAKCQTALYTGSPTVGSTITFKGKKWIVAHKSGNNIYVSNSVIESDTTFGINNTYLGSKLASAVTAFQNNLSLTPAEQILIPNTTVNGVTAKVFVASYEQMNGGWSYFNSNARRICKYRGSTYTYWTSSPDDAINVWVVTEKGVLTSFYGTDRAANGLRPSICLPA